MGPYFPKLRVKKIMPWLVSGWALPPEWLQTTARPHTPELAHVWWNAFWLFPNQGNKELGLPLRTCILFYSQMWVRDQKIEKVDSDSSQSQPSAPNGLFPLTPRTSFNEFLVCLSRSSMQIRALWIYVHTFSFRTQKPTYCTRCSASYFFH